MGCLRYVLYKREELLQEGRLPLDIGHLFRHLRQCGITPVDLSGVPLSEGADLWKEIAPLLEEAVLITSRDATLEEIKHLPLAAIGYKNRELEGQELFGAYFLVESFEDTDYDFLERVYRRKHGLPWRVIDTERCYLREMTLEDLPALYRLYEGAGITDYIEPLMEWEEEVEYARAYIEQMYPYFGYGMWLVMDGETGELIGRAGLNPNIVNDEYLLEMGYIIAAEYQGKGYGREVCEAILAYAKEAGLGFDKVYCFVRKGNRASLALLDHLGFSYEREEMRDGKEMLRFSMELS